jgi:hypothetical protein
MACQIITCDGAVFALWGKPTKDDLELVCNEVKQMAAKMGRPIIYLTRVPVDSPAPDPDVRQRLNELMPEFQRACSSYHVVLEGVGFVSSLKRTILASLMQVGWRRGAFHVHAFAKQVVFSVTREARPDAEAIVALAEREGLLSAPGPIEPGLSRFGGAAPIGKDAPRSPRA